MPRITNYYTQKFFIVYALFCIENNFTFFHLLYDINTFLSAFQHPIALFYYYIFLYRNCDGSEYSEYYKNAFETRL